MMIMLTMMIDSSEGCDIQIQILFSITNLKDAPDERRQERGCHIPYAIVVGLALATSTMTGNQTNTDTHTNKQTTTTNSIIQILYKH